MTDDRLTAFYAESARRWETARQEFAERTHGWHFALTPEANQWAETFPVTTACRTPSAWAADLVERATADGVVHIPEPGRLRTAYAHRDSETEQEVAVGFGFYPAASEVLVVRADTAIRYDAITPAIGTDGTAALTVLRAIVASFATVRPFASPPGTVRG